MIEVSKVKELVYRIAGKQSHGMPSINDFNAFLELASLELFNQETGQVVEYYLKGNATSKSMFGITKKVNNNLRPFIVNNHSMTRNNDGIFAFPAGVAYVDSVNTTDGYNVTWADNPIRYLRNSIDYPTVEYPIYADVAGGIEVFPNQVTQVLMDYLKFPVKPLYATKLDTGKIVFDEAQSVNLEWDITLLGAITARVLKHMGIELRDDEIRQYAQLEQQTTG